jgi:hypothetical protein
MGHLGLFSDESCCAAGGDDAAGPTPLGRWWDRSESTYAAHRVSAGQDAQSASASVRAWSMPGVMVVVASNNRHSPQPLTRVTIVI